MAHFVLTCAAVLTILGSTFAMADSLELADGSVLEGDFVGSSNGIIMFNTGEDIEAYPEAEVVGLYFTEGVENAAAMAATDAAGNLVVPAGTRLVIRTIEAIDSRRHGAGHRFRGQLESALVVDGKTIAPRGTILHGRITQAKQAGRVAGRSALAIEFTDIMIDDELFAMVTGSLAAQTGGEAGRTLGRSARAAAIGGLIDGSSGARTGAKVGAGASILTGGASINVPRGTILETSLRADLSLPR